MVQFPLSMQDSALNQQSSVWIYPEIPIMTLIIVFELMYIQENYIYPFQKDFLCIDFLHTYMNLTTTKP